MRKRGARRAFALLFACAFAAEAQTASAGMQREFVLEGIDGKCAMVEAVVDGGVSDEERQLVLLALRFAVEAYGHAGSEPRLRRLAEAAVNACRPESDPRLMPALADVFRTFADEAVRSAVLEKILSSPQDITMAVPLMNSYISECARSGAFHDGTVSRAVEALARLGDGSSFDVLFAALRDGSLPAFEREISDAVAMISERSRAEVYSVLFSAPESDRRMLFSLLVDSPRTSDRLRAEIAESLIAGARESSVPAQMQGEAVRVIRELRWTRSAASVEGYFPFAEEEYEASVIDRNQFMDVIVCIAELASLDAGQLLSRYLERLNDSVRAGSTPDEAVVLAVVDALGALGDKAAFDCLLAATYLPYSDIVTRAARDALANVRW